MIWVNSMGLLDMLNHLLNFVAPAAVVALLLTLTRRFIRSKSPVVLSLPSHAAIIFIVGVAALSAGLVLWGRDGKMLSYAALVVACATCQWVLARGWRA